MRRMPFSALAVWLLFALGQPAAAQVQRPAPPTRNNGGIQIDMSGIFGALVTEAAKQAAQEALRRANEPKEPTKTVEPTPGKAKPAPKKTPTVIKTRDVPVPRARPNLYEGRPILFDAPYDLESLVVIMRPGSTEAEIAALDNELEMLFELTLIEQRRFALGGARVARYRVPQGGNVKDLIAALVKIPEILSAQPQYIYRATQESAASADLKALQYAPQKLNALAARAEGNGEGVSIGLIDTGLDLNQPELAHADIEIFDVMKGRPVTDRGHGTALAGLMLAGPDFDGIAPGAHLVSVRAFDTGADGTAISGSYEIAAAIELAVDKRVQLLNLSFAGPRDPLVMSMLDAAAAEGVVLVAAAGNGGPDAAPAYPGAHRDAIAVTATDISDNIFEGANRGYYIAVSAPGVDVLSPMPEGKFELLSGTSIATAHVSAIIALMLEHNPDLGRDDIVGILEDSARDLGEPGHDADFGAGLADAAAAVSAIQVK